MTNKEAIEKLTNLLNAYEYAQKTNTQVMVELNGIEAEALDLAINALEKIETYKNAYRIMSDAFENEVRKKSEVIICEERSDRQLAECLKELSNLNNEGS